MILDGAAVLALCGLYCFLIGDALRRRTKRQAP